MGEHGAISLADKDLILRLQANIAGVIMLNQNLTEAHVEDFRLLTFGDARADDVNLIRRRTSRDAADAL